MIVWRGAPEWRHENGPGYQLRQYDHGRPTGRVATVTWEGQDDDRTREVISGPDVWLVREHHWITVIGHQSSDHAAMRLRFPLRSCQDATLHDEPGLPGDALVRLTLTVQIGSSTVTMPLWFPCQDRRALERLARLIRTRASEQAPVTERAPVTDPSPQPSATLVPLVVEQAPDNDDWIVFRPSSSSDDAAVGRGTARPDASRHVRRAVRRP
jgi:hypothetical protein